MKKNLMNKVNYGVMKLQGKAKEDVELAIKKLEEDDGNWVEEGLKYIIAIVIGGVLLVGLINIFNVDLLGGIKTGINNLFNYKG